MKSKKKIVLSLVAVGLAGVLLGSLFGHGTQPILTTSTHVFALPESPQSSESMPLSPAIIPGVTYTGSYIRIGVNKGGTFCVGDTATVGTGFQFPIGSQHESLAAGWWVEGYAVFYKVKTTTGWVDNRAYWWPILGWPPPAASRIVPVYAVQRRNDTNRAIYEVRVQTVDKVLNVTFKFSFPKPQKYVLLETKITNTGVMGTVRDVLYKRIVDWDVHGNAVDNRWTNDAHAAYASGFNSTSNKWFTMSVAGYTPTALENQVSYVDLCAWDDTDPPLPRGPGTMDIQSHDQPLWGDGNAAVCYDLGNIASGATKTVVTVYQAGWHYDQGISAAMHALTIKIVWLYGPGTTNPPPGIHAYSAGTTVSVTAIPADNFWYWELDGVDYYINPIYITMNADHELLAWFGFP